NQGTTFTIVYWILAFAAFCTAFYMGRQLMMVFFGKPRHEAAQHAHESPKLMTVPLVVLATLTILGGTMNLPNLKKAAEHGAEAGVSVTLALEHWLEKSLLIFELAEEGGELAAYEIPHTPTELVWLVAIVSTALALSGLLLAMLVIYRKRPQTAVDPDPLEKLKPLWWFRILPLETFYMKVIVSPFNWLADWLAFAVDWTFWHDFVHNNIIRDMFVSFSTFLADVFDKYGVDGTVNGIGNVTKGLAGVLRKTQTGYARSYALGIFFGAVLLLAYFLWFAF
ncbi:MAG: hypothetical protein GWP17_06505, partial [Aquificales bacterium]|nr:hypothetical protein [Aquificales bacterium]